MKKETKGKNGGRRVLLYLKPKRCTMGQDPPPTQTWEEEMSTLMPPTKEGKTPPKRKDRDTEKYLQRTSTPKETGRGGRESPPKKKGDKKGTPPQRKTRKKILNLPGK